MDSIDETMDQDSFADVISKVLSKVKEKVLENLEVENNAIRDLTEDILTAIETSLSTPMIGEDVVMNDESNPANQTLSPLRVLDVDGLMVTLRQELLKNEQFNLALDGDDDDVLVEEVSTVSSQPALNQAKPLKDKQVRKKVPRQTRPQFILCPESYYRTKNVQPQNLTRKRVAKSSSPANDRADLFPAIQKAPPIKRVRFAEPERTYFEEPENSNAKDFFPVSSSDQHQLVESQSLTPEEVSRQVSNIFREIHFQAPSPAPGSSLLESIFQEGVAGPGSQLAITSLCRNCNKSPPNCNCSVLAKMLSSTSPGRHFQSQNYFQPENGQTSTRKSDVFVYQGNFNSLLTNDQFLEVFERDLHLAASAKKDKLREANVDRMIALARALEKQNPVIIESKFKLSHPTSKAFRKKQQEVTAGFSRWMKVWVIKKEADLKKQDFVFFQNPFQHLFSSEEMEEIFSDVSDSDDELGFYYNDSEEEGLSKKNSNFYEFDELLESEVNENVQLIKTKKKAALKKLQNEFDEELEREKFLLSKYTSRPLTIVSKSTTKSVIKMVPPHTPTSTATLKPEVQLENLLAKPSINFMLLLPPQTISTSSFKPIDLSLPSDQGPRPDLKAQSSEKSILQEQLNSRGQNDLKNQFYFEQQTRYMQLRKEIAQNQVSTQTSPKPTSDNVSSNVETTPLKGYPCSWNKCGRRFKLLEQLKDHVRTVHLKWSKFKKSY